jgi:hypothetical protein
MKHLSEEDLILIYYGEPDAPQDAREHLRECSECAAGAEALRRTMELCEAAVVPEPAPDFSDKLWSRLEGRLVETKARRSWKLWLVPAFGVAAAAIALLLINPAGPRTPRAEVAFSDEARSRILAMALADHLDRSQMLLTELENGVEVDGQDLEPLRNRAQELVSEGRLMRQWIAQGQQRSTLAVVDQVERVLTETANASGGAEEIRALREHIGADSLLFKVRVVEANLRTEGQRS